jgi:hypothetical protein
MPGAVFVVWQTGINPVVALGLFDNGGAVSGAPDRLIPAEIRPMTH